MGELSVVVVGSTGSGKSEHEKCDEKRIADAGEYAIVKCETKSTTARATLGQWFANGHGRRIVWDEFASTDKRALAYDMLPDSDNPDPFLQRTENELIRDGFKQMFLAQKGMLSDESAGFTREALDFSMNVYAAQFPRKRLDWLRLSLEPGHPHFVTLVQDCRVEAVKVELLEKFRLYRRAAGTFDSWAGAARRMLKTMDSAPFLVRCNPPPGLGFVWMKALEAKKLIILNGAGVARPTARLLFLSAMLQVVNACRRYHARFRRALKVVLILEECGAYGLAAPFLLVALAGVARSWFGRACADAIEQGFLTGSVLEDHRKLPDSPLVPGSRSGGSRGRGEESFRADLGQQADPPHDHATDSHGLQENRREVEGTILRRAGKGMDAQRRENEHDLPTDLRRKDRRALLVAATT